MISMAEKEELYTEYRKKVAGYVFGKLQNRHDAEDIVSEIFLKVYEKYSARTDAKRNCPKIFPAATSKRMNF